MTAPSENVSVKLNTTVYANVVLNKKKHPIHFSMLIRALKLEKKIWHKKISRDI